MHYIYIPQHEVFSAIFAIHFISFLSLLKKDSVGGAADLILSGMPSQLSFLTIRERLLSDESGVGYPVFKQK